MKKRDLASLALMGICTGMIVTGCGKKRDSLTERSTLEQTAPEVQTFYNTLTPQAQKKFRQLDDKHKAAAIKMFNQDCSGKNECAGLGGCKTDAHSCAGQNDCKGQGGDPARDTNGIVDLQFTKQQKERAGASQSMKNGGA